MKKDYEEWLDGTKEYTAKQIINYLVNYLTEDISWLKKNISQVDKEILFEAIQQIKG